MFRGFRVVEHYCTILSNFYWPYGWSRLWHTDHVALCYLRSITTAKTQNELEKKIFDFSEGRFDRIRERGIPGYSVPFLALCEFTNCICTPWEIGKCSLSSIVNSPVPCMRTTAVSIQTIVQYRYVGLEKWCLVFHLCHWMKSSRVTGHISQQDLQTERGWIRWSW